MKRFAIYVLLITVIAIAFVTSCDKGGDMPTPEPATFWFYSDSSTPAGASAQAFDDGKTLSTSTISQDNKYKSSKMNVPNDSRIDSFVVSMPGYQRKVFTNIAVTENGNKRDVNLTKIPVGDKIFWIYSEKSTAGANAQAFDDGKTLSTSTVSQDSTYKSANMDYPKDGKLDSVVVSKAGYQKKVFKNVAVTENGNKLDFILEQIPEEKIFWLFSNNSTPTGAGVKPYDNGQELSASTVGQDNTFKSSNMAYPVDGKLDSIVVSMDGYDKEVFKNVAVTENGNQFDFALQEQPQYITLDGRTFMIGKIADERNYSLKDPSYIDSRVEGNVSFLFLTADGNFKQQVTSDADGKFHLQIPKAEMGQTGIYIMNPSDKMYGAMIAVALDSLKNTENVGALNRNVDRRNMLQGHMGYEIDENGNIVNLSPDTKHATSNWTQEGERVHYVVTKIYDEVNSVLTDNIVTQEMKDLVYNSKTNLNRVLNDFFSRGTTVEIDDFAKATQKTNMDAFYWSEGGTAGGYFGKIESNGVVQSTTASVNKSLVGNTFVITALTQELGSNEMFYEISSSRVTTDPKPPLTVYDGMQPADGLTDNDRVSHEWYNIRSEKESELDPTKGIWNGTGDIDQIAMEQGKNLQDVQDYISTYGSAEAQAKFAEIQSSTKAAMMPQTTYTFKTIMPDGDVTTRVFTSRNYREALGDKTIPKLYQQSIRETFEK